MSNAGPGLSPNKQSATGKVSATNLRGDTVSAGYRTGTPRDGRETARSQSPDGLIKTGAPVNMTRNATGITAFSTKQPHSPGRALGTPGKLTGK